MGSFQPRKDLQNPELIKRIYELRKEGESFLHISKLVLEEFNIKVSSLTVNRIYDKYIARQLFIGAEADKKLAATIVPDYQAKMDARFDKIARVTDDLMDLLEKLKKEKSTEEYIKYIPTVLAVSREILSQLAFIKREQSQILVNQKNMIYSPLQIMQVLNKELVKLEKDGKVLIRATPDLMATRGRVRTEEEKREMAFVKKKDENLEEAEVDT